MLGYVWPPEDYPWLSLYRSVVDGKIAARGLEFGNKDTPLRLLFAASSGWHGGVFQPRPAASELVVKPIRAADSSGALHLTRQYTVTWSRLTGRLSQRASTRRRCASRLIAHCSVDACFILTRSFPALQITECEGARQHYSGHLNPCLMAERPLDRSICPAAAVLVRVISRVLFCPLRSSLFHRLRIQWVHRLGRARWPLHVRVLLPRTLSQNRFDVVVPCGDQPVHRNV